MTQMSPAALLSGLATLHPVPTTSFKAEQKTGLVIVDVVNGFCTPGAGQLAPAQSDPAIESMIVHIDRLAREFADRGMPIYVVRDEHDADRPEPPYPEHCVRGTGEENLVPALEWLHDYDNSLVVPKDCINLIIGSIDEKGRNGFFEWISENDLTGVIFVGICTDICIVDPVVTLLSARNHRAKNGSDAIAFFPELKDVVVYEPGCSTYHLPSSVTQRIGLPDTVVHDAPIAHYIGLWTMKSRGAIISDQVEFDR